MTREEVLLGLKLVHYFFTFYEGSEAGFHMYRGSIVDDAIRKAIPAAIELLKVVEDSPPPPPLREDPYADNINYLNAWVAELEGAVRRVEERVDTHELYLSQAQNDYEKRRDE